MKNQLIISSILFLISQVFSACTKEPINPTYETPEQYIEDIDFQGSILIRKDNQDILRQGFGMANRKNKTSNDVNTAFRIGSMSKAFTVLGMVKLKREGFVTSFDQKVSDFVPDFPSGDSITLRHLMTHSSGIPDHVLIFEDLMIDEDLCFTAEDMIETIAEKVEEDGLQFTPGETHQYSNGNYLFLAVLIEKLSGKNYHEYLQETLVNLEMNNTYKGEDIITGSQEARGYRNRRDVGDYPMEIAFGAGDWVSNITDLEKWADAWLNDLLSDAEKSEVFATPLQDDVTAFGMGWFSIQTEGKLVYFHGGDINGFTSLIVLFPETNGMLIALSNQENQRKVLDQMIEVFAKYEF